MDVSRAFDRRSRAGRPTTADFRRRLPSPSSRSERYRGGTRGRHGFYDGSRGRGHRGGDGVVKHVDKRVRKDVRGRYDHHGEYGYYLGYPWPWYYGYGYGYGFGFGYGYGYYPWGFSYAAPVTVAYVPFGFYVDRPAVWVREVTVVEEVPVVVREEVPVFVREGESVAPEGALVKTSEWSEEEEPRGEAGETAPPVPAEVPPAPEEGPPTFDATTEKYLRDGSSAFAKADYEAAAEAFRMAVVANPGAPAPMFAFGQALIALGDYPYAARVLREALGEDRAILNAPGSIAGVYRDAEEFAKVLSALKAEALARPADPDLLFLLLYERYFAGDPQAMVAFDRLKEVRPGDPAIELFGPALEKRFPELARFPPSTKKGETPPEERQE